jgi:hypothetical protein
MRRVAIDVATGTGTTGTVNASSDTVPGHNGKLYALYLDYGSTVTSITNVTLALTTPVLTLFTVSDNSSDGWYWPRETAVTQSGTAYGSTAGVLPFPIVGDLRLSVSSSTPSVTAVTGYVFIEEQ